MHIYSSNKYTFTINQSSLYIPIHPIPSLVPRRRWIIWRILRTRQIRRIQDLIFYSSVNQRSNGLNVKYYHFYNGLKQQQQRKRNSDFKTFRRQERKQTTWFIRNAKFSKFIPIPDDNELKREERKKKDTHNVSYNANAKQRELCHLLNSTIYFPIRSIIDTFIMTNKDSELIFKKDLS